MIESPPDGLAVGIVGRGGGPLRFITLMQPGGGGGGAEGGP